MWKNFPEILQVHVIYVEDDELERCFYVALSYFYALIFWFDERSLNCVKEIVLEDFLFIHDLIGVFCSSQI